MATIFLKRREIGGEGQPRVCIVCGERPARKTHVTFSYNPRYWWTYFSNVIVTRYQEANVPLCEDHEHYFDTNLWMVLIGIVILLGLVGTLVAIGFALPGYLFGVMLTGFFLFVATILTVSLTTTLVRDRSIHTDEINNRGMRLKRVSQEFVDALWRVRGDERDRNEEDEVDSNAVMGLSIAGIAVIWVLFLTCGGVGTMIYSGYKSAQAVADTVEDTLDSKADAGEAPVETMDEALTLLKTGNDRAKLGAARWVARQAVIPEKQAEVAQAMNGLLGSREWELHRQAVRALLAWGTKENVPSLCRLLDFHHGKSGRTEYVVPIMQVLGKLKDERAVPHVARYLGYAFSEGSAAEACLRHIGLPGAPALVAGYNDTNAGTRNRVRGLLKEMQAPDALIAQQCLNDLRNRDKARREMAADGLAKLEADPALQPAVARALVPLLEEPNRLSSHALDALDVWATKDCILRLVEVAKDGTFKDQKGKAVRVLAKLQAPEAAAVLAEELPRKDEYAKKALLAIGKAAEKDVLPLLNHPSGKHMAREILEAYGTSSEKQIRQSMEDLKSTDSGTQAGAIELLGKVPLDEKLRPEVAKALGPWARKVPEFAYNNDPTVLAVTRWATREIVPQLLEMAQHRSEPIQKAALSACVDLKDERATELLIKHLQAEFFKRDYWTRELVRLGPAGEKTIQEKLLHHPDPKWQQAGCELLAAMGTKASLDDIKAVQQRAVAARNVRLAQAAILAIQAISRRP